MSIKIHEWCSKELKRLRAMLVQGLIGGLCKMPTVLRNALFISLLVPGNMAGIALADQRSGVVITHANQLPSGVRRMHQALLAAARSGEIDQMREVLQMNELMPLINGQFIKDPVASWKAGSQDQTGREILAVFTQLLELPPVKKNTAGGALYIWPYFAGVSLAKLSPPEIVRLYRLAGAKKIAKMLTSNRYSHAVVIIGADGTWHSFDH